MRGIYDEDSSPAMVRLGRAAGISKDVNDWLHLLFLCADEQGNVAPPQKTTGAGDASHAMALSDQLLNHASGINVTDDGNDQFHWNLVSSALTSHNCSQLLKALDIKDIDRRSAHLRLNHHRLDLKHWSLNVGWNEAPTSVTAFTDVLQETGQMRLVKTDEQRHSSLVQDTTTGIHLSNVKPIPGQHVGKLTGLGTGYGDDDQLIDNII
jgi:hypothetical protein